MDLVPITWPIPLWPSTTAVVSVYNYFKYLFFSFKKKSEEYNVNAGEKPENIDNIEVKK